MGGVSGKLAKMNIDESAFESLAEKTLQRFATRIEEATVELEVDFEDGILNIEANDGGIYLVNKHTALRQLWLSSPVSGAGHFVYDAASETWISTRGGDSLESTLQRELSAAADVTVALV